MTPAVAFLVNPPSPAGRVSNKDSMGGFGQLYPAGAPPFPPLDIPYLAATLTHANHAVRVFESVAMGWSLDQLCAEIAREPEAANALYVVRTSLPTIDCDLETCAALRAAFPSARILIYGPVVKPLLWRVQREPAVDYAVIGEADQPVLELMEGAAADAVSGLVWRDGANWHRNAERPFEKNLDGLSFPRWDLMPYEKYTLPKSAVAGTLRFLPMLTSRGCPFGCNYCPYPVGQGLAWRKRSPANVVDELEHLVRDLGVQYVIFRDPLFSANKQRVAAICEDIIARKLAVKWRCETRIDCLDEPTIAIMAKAGCVGVNFGVESVDPQVQKNVERKPITEEQFVETVALLRKHGIATFAFFVIGLPGDTVDTILTTVAFALRLGASWTQFTTATPFIGTRLHDWAVEQGFVAQDHYRIANAHEELIGNENLDAGQVHRLHRFAQFMQKNFINRRGVLKNELRNDWSYRTARHTVDRVMAPIERTVFNLGSAMLRRSIRQERGHGPATVVTQLTRKRDREAAAASS